MQAGLAGWLGLAGWAGMAFLAGCVPRDCSGYWLAMTYWRAWSGWTGLLECPHSQRPSCCDPLFQCGAKVYSERFQKGFFPTSPATSVPEGVFVLPIPPWICNVCVCVRVSVRHRSCCCVPHVLEWASQSMRIQGRNSARL